MTVCCQPLVGLKMTSRDQLSQWEDTGMPMSSATINVSTFASYSIFFPILQLGQVRVDIR